MSPAEAAGAAASGTNVALSTDSDARFVDYYASESLSAQALQRFHAIRRIVIAALGKRAADAPLDVADIGCNAGTQCHIWAAEGHRVVGVDINASLIELARQRAFERGLDIRFSVASATDLPLADDSVDVCIAPELLEHVADWQSCLSEFMRIVRPGGVLYLSTTNRLCPMQEEFHLPLYSWYPGFLKRHYERLAMTTRPGLAGYARYPAVNWFTYFGLRAHLGALGFDCMDRFDVMETEASSMKRIAQAAIRDIPGVRRIAHCFSPYTQVVAVRRRTPGR